MKRILTAFIALFITVCGSGQSIGEWWVIGIDEDPLLSTPAENIYTYYNLEQNCIFTVAPTTSSIFKYMLNTYYGFFGNEPDDSEVNILIGYYDENTKPIDKEFVTGKIYPDGQRIDFFSEKFHSYMITKRGTIRIVVPRYSFVFPISSFDLSFPTFKNSNIN